MKSVKTFRVHWSWGYCTNMNYCCLRSLTQSLISNNKEVWGNEAGFARQPESLHTVSGGVSIWSTFLSQFPVLQLVLIDFLHSQALTSLQDWREGLCWLLRESSSLLSPKTPVHFSSWAIRELIISAVPPAALLLYPEQAGIPGTGMELPSMQRQLRLGKYCHRALGQPSFKMFESLQTHFAHDSIKSVQ